MVIRKAGQIVLLRFPQTDLARGKLRPVLLLAPLPSEYNDWLICMISSQRHRYVEGLDELVKQNSKDFIQSGLKSESVIRVTRLAVVSSEIMLGTIGKISPARLKKVKNNLANWIRRGKHD